MLCISWWISDSVQANPKGTVSLERRNTGEPDCYGTTRVWIPTSNTDCTVVETTAEGKCACLDLILQTSLLLQLLSTDILHGLNQLSLGANFQIPPSCLVVSVFSFAFGMNYIYLYCSLWFIFKCNYYFFVHLCYENIFWISIWSAKLDVTYQIRIFQFYVFILC